MVPRSSAVFLLLTYSWTYGSNESNKQGMFTRHFEGLPNVVEVECSGRGLGANIELFSMTLYSIVGDVVLASVSLNKNECGTSSSFSACFIDNKDPFNTRLKTLVVDLKSDEERNYGCNISMKSGGRPAILNWAVSAKLAKTNNKVAASTVLPAYTVLKAIDAATDIPIVAEVQDSETSDIEVPTSAVVVGLILLIFFVILTVVLIILRYRGRDSWSSHSPQSQTPDDLYAKPIHPADKDRKIGLGGDAFCATPGHLPAFGHVSRNPPFIMRYQTPLDDTGYVSGSSMHYAEPWGRPDNEAQDRLRLGGRAAGQLLSDKVSRKGSHSTSNDDKGCNPHPISQQNSA